MKITKIKQSGKWLLFWFSNGTEQSCKDYMFWNLMTSDLEEHRLNFGVVGLTVRWEDDHPIEVFLEPKEPGIKAHFSYTHYNI